MRLGHCTLRDVPKRYALAIDSFVHLLEVSADVQVCDGEVDEEVSFDVELLLEKRLLLDSLLEVALHDKVVKL